MRKENKQFRLQIKTIK